MEGLSGYTVAFERSGTHRVRKDEVMYGPTLTKRNTGRRSQKFVDKQRRDGIAGKS